MQIEQIKNQIDSLLQQMGFSDFTIEITEEPEQLSVQIETLPEQSGIIIGHHGEGIDALQLITNLIVNNQSDTWTRILVNVNDYRQMREETVKSMASKAAENAKTTGKEVVLNYLPSHERRIAHMHLDQDPDVHTYSQGQGKFRRLVVSPNQ